MHESRFLIDSFFPKREINYNRENRTFDRDKRPMFTTLHPFSSIRGGLAVVAKVVGQIAIGRVKYRVLYQDLIKIAKKETGNWEIRC